MRIFPAARLSHDIKEFENKTKQLYINMLLRLSKCNTQTANLKRFFGCATVQLHQVDSFPLPPIRFPSKSFPSNLIESFESMGSFDGKTMKRLTTRT